MSENNVTLALVVWNVLVATFVWHLLYDLQAELPPQKRPVGWFAFFMVWAMYDRFGDSGVYMTYAFVWVLVRVIACEERLIEMSRGQQTDL